MTAEDIRRRLIHLPQRKRKRKMPPPLGLRRLEQAHAARIMTLVNPYEELVRSELLPLLDVIVSESKVRVDDPTDIVERVFNSIRVRLSGMFTGQAITRSAIDTARAIDNAGRRLNRKQFRTVFNVDPVAAEPWLEQEINTFVSENASLIKTLPEESLADIEQLVFRDARRGQSPQQIRESIIEQFDVTRSRAQLIARDQVSKFNGRLSELRQTQMGITRYEWQTAEDGRVRDDHERLNGTIQSWDEPPITVTKGKRAGERNHPGQDIQCIPGWSKVKVFGGTNKLIRRRHSGELTQIITDTGAVLSATANHPVLTANGWEPIDTVSFGDYIFKGSNKGRKFFKQNIGRSDLAIDAVFNALFYLLPVVRRPGAASQFHGDGADQEIEIIETTCVLPDEFNTTTGQDICKLILTCADQTLPNSFLVVLRPLELAGNALWNAPDGLVRGLCKLLTLLNRQSFHADHVRLAAAARFYAKLKKASTDGAAMYSVLFGNSELAQSSEVVTDDSLNIKLFSIMSRAASSAISNKTPSAERLAEVVGADIELPSGGGKRIALLDKPLRVIEKKTGEFDSHVYNIETTSGWYLSDDIIIHNCRCQALPVVEDLL